MNNFSHFSPFGRRAGWAGNCQIFHEEKRLVMDKQDDPTRSQEHAATYEQNAKNKTTKKKRDKPQGKKPLLPPKTKLLQRYEVEHVIGAGGYGQIFRGVLIGTQENDANKRYVAIKVMLRDHEPQRMVLEQKVLAAVKNTGLYPKLYGSGQVPGMDLMFLIMELLGPNLSDLRKQRPFRRFDPATCIRVGLQCVSSLKTLHRLGYVHRDMKPANMCCGRNLETIQRVYIVDFGLARQFKDSKGRIIMRTYAGFRGTLRYVSVNVHERKDQCASDDLLSLYYAICEMSEGNLPWARLRDQDQVFQLKKSSATLTKQLPESFSAFYTKIMDYENPHEPDYDDLMDILKGCLPSNFDDKTPYDWEDFFVPGPKERTLGSKERLSILDKPTADNPRSARPTGPVTVRSTNVSKTLSPFNNSKYLMNDQFVSKNGHSKRYIDAKKQ